MLSEALHLASLSEMRRGLVFTDDDRIKDTAAERRSTMGGEDLGGEVSHSFNK